MLKNFIKNWLFAKPSIVTSTSCYVRSIVRVSLQSGWYWFLHLRSTLTYFIKKRKISIPFIFQNWTTWSIIAIIKSYRSHPSTFFGNAEFESDEEERWEQMWRVKYPLVERRPRLKLLVAINSFLNLSIRVDSSTLNGMSMRGWTLAFPLSVDSFWWMMTKAW